MEKQIFLSQSITISLVLGLSFLFIIFGIYYSKKHQGINNYLLANRSVGIFSLTASLVSSALGTWILFGPASAATWGGIGAVIGIAIGVGAAVLVVAGSVFLAMKKRRQRQKNIHRDTLCESTLWSVNQLCEDSSTTVSN